MGKIINVIIPAFNCGRFLEHTILSVFSQITSHKIVTLISNDLSNDNTSEILKRIKKTYVRDNFEIEIFDQKSNLGEVLNTKFLLDRCDGDYIAYLDADDFWIDPHKIEEQIDFLEKNKKSSMCFTGYIQYKEGDYIPSADGSSWLGPPPNIDSSNPISPEMLISTNFISSSSRVFRNYKNLVLEYFSDFPYSDWPLNFELAMRGEINFINKPTYCYRIHESSFSFRLMKEKEDEMKYKNRVDLLKKRYESNGKIL